MKASVLLFVVAIITSVTLYTMQLPADDPVEQQLLHAQTMVAASNQDISYAKQNNERIITLLKELQQIAADLSDPNSIVTALEKQHDVITIVASQEQQLLRLISQGEEINLYKQKIITQNSSQHQTLNDAYNDIHTNIVLLSGDVEKNILITHQIITLVVTILQQKLSPQKKLLDLLLQAENNIELLLTNKQILKALQAASLIIEIGKIIGKNATNIQKAALDQINSILHEIEKLLPPQPVITTPSSTPDKKRPDVTISEPAKPTAPTPTAPGKAAENIQKVNNKLSSALRRLENVKKYYPEMDREEKDVIKKKALSIIKEYETDFSGLVQKIQQIKHDMGTQLHETKLAPFNSFVELVNKLFNSVNGL